MLKVTVSDRGYILQEGFVANEAEAQKFFYDVIRHDNLPMAGYVTEEVEITPTKWEDERHDPFGNNGEWVDGEFHPY